MKLSTWLWITTVNLIPHWRGSEMNYDLKKDFEKLGSDLSSARQVSSVLRERVTSLECQCWSSSQYSRWQCLELTGIPKTSDNNVLENTENL